jgi:ABC-type lipoprotein release transport system permease subunit
MMYVALSWRNLWRNRKRTLIAAGSVFFAVLLALLMRSGQNGSYAYMIDSSAKLFTGYLQVQEKGYWENRSLDRSMEISPEKQKMLSRLPHVTVTTERLAAFALVSRKTSTKVAQIVGIDPGPEDDITGLKGRLVEGRYLTARSDGVLIAAGLAEALHISLGDRLIIYGQGFHGQMAAARLPVIGIVKLPFPQMNNGLVYLALPEAQRVFSADGRITSEVVMVDGIGHLASVKERIRRRMGQGYAVMGWDEMMPDLVQSIALDNATGIIMLVILYIVIAFGLFGTVMMMTSERLKEFGILISVGMRRTKLILVTTLETLFISLLGVLAGIGGGIPIIAYLHAHPVHMTGDAAKAFETIGVAPILNFSMDPHLFLSQSCVVLAIALATALYPVFSIRRLRPAEAIHG